jgi:hypothetical protein
MSEDRPVTLEFIAAQLHRVLSELSILCDDLDVVAAASRGIGNGFDRLETGLRSEMREIRDELRAMHRSSSAPRRGCAPSRRRDMATAELMRTADGPSTGRAGSRRWPHGVAPRMDETDAYPSGPVPTAGQSMLRALSS